MTKNDHSYLMALRQAGFNIHVVDPVMQGQCISAIMSALQAARRAGDTGVDKIQHAFDLMTAYVSMNELLPGYKFDHHPLKEIKAIVRLSRAQQKREQASAMKAPKRAAK